MSLLNDKLLGRALTIAGSDSGGGAGIQADLKTFTAFKVYGTSVLTALTAQNTLGVSGIHPIQPDFVEKQARAVLDDIGADALKTGMLFDSSVVKCVAKLVSEYGLTKVVVDPVMVATSGDRLLAEDAIESIQSVLLPLAFVVTPNVPEAEILAGISITSLEDMKTAAVKIHQLGAKHVLVKGGHLPLDGQYKTAQSLDSAMVLDLLYDGSSFEYFKHPFVNTKNTHGTGCTLSAAITAGLAIGQDVKQAVQDALRYVQGALVCSISVGKGHGPLNHVHALPSPAKIGGFVHKLMNYCAPEWDLYVNHPFVQQMGDGTLPMDSFTHYICQDYIFLLHYARVNALAAFKENDMDSIMEAAEFVIGIGHETKKLHIEYGEQYGITRDQLIKTKEASANLAYTRYVLDKGTSGDRLDLLVAVAPCCLGYAEIGYRLMTDPKTKQEGNPYWKWIVNYGCPEFQKIAVDMKEKLERLAYEMVPSHNTNRLIQLCENYKQATILEANFWENADADADDGVLG
ncbi:Phosphomethylpyrimidine kinase-domain-containing protein [Polychytrium aggregatum]|uniref:Phosphomethylpyrimidine kinase-domain-containing protein n=1 Tax=Polychytrium aggregatum TaxID=110093 RepID=UPI0022FEDA02|nr:Phosphomethylpyrimidine kinase-domain-containing protein [Polychytrium aggregatum]KAI9203045.1 Phosphomethylpyrimidine kinase-domain-containing protein [Polychytrium aggregatum]